MSLKRRALKAAFWVGVERFGQQAIQFFVSILLARLLEPAEFGLVAMISVFMAVSGALINGGFASSLIQKTDVSHIDESTVFWFNLFISVGMMAILWAAAPWIADFYNQPRLVSITRWCSLNLLLTGFGVVQMALLQKEFLIVRRMIATMSSIIISGVVSAWMAVKGYGVWALVAQCLVMNVVMILVIWILHPWRPLFVFSIRSFKTLFGFGSRLLGCSLMTAVFENMYQLIIGKLYSATELGLFQRAKKLMELCANVPITLITQIQFPYLCKIQDDPAAMKSVFLKVLKYAAMFIFPLLVGLAVSAPNLIVVLIGEKWLPCVGYLRILCATGVFFSVYFINLDVFKACGNTGLILKLEFYKRLVLGVSILLLYRYGIEALLYGELFFTFVTALVSSVLIRRFISIGFWSQVKSLAPFVVGALSMGFVVALIGRSAFSPLCIFCLQGFLGSFLYILYLWGVRNREFLEVFSMVNRLDLTGKFRRGR